MTRKLVRSRMQIFLRALVFLQPSRGMYGACKKLFNEGITVIDLSADFRLHDPRFLKNGMG